jgi:hypothetical protein
MGKKDLRFLAGPHLMKSGSVFNKRILQCQGKQPGESIGAFFRCHVAGFPEILDVVVNIPHAGSQDDQGNGDVEGAHDGA